MRIGFDARILLGQGRGMSRATWELVRALSRIDSSNEYYLFSDRPLNLPEELPGNFRTVILTPSKRSFSWANSCLVKGAKKLQIDIMHFTYNNLWVRKPCKTVITIYDVIPYTSKKEQFKTLSQRLAGILYLWAFKNIADKIITVSHASGEEISKILNLDQALIDVVYCGVDSKFFSLRIDSKMELTIQKFNIIGDYLFYVGGFDPRKNIMRAIDAFGASLKELSDDIKFVLAGNHESQYGKELRNYIASKGLSNRISLIGWVAEDELVCLYKGAKAFIFPSLEEGFGLPILEAMASGVPVITSNCSSLKEVAGEAALLVDPNCTSDISKGVCRILTDTEFSKKLAIKGIKRANEFKWDNTARNILSIYRKVVQAC